MSTFVKDPDAKLDYSIDWSGWLPEGDSVLNSTWSVPAGLTKHDESLGAGVATVWLSGGLDRQRYEVTNRITTAAGRIDERTITLDARQR